MFSCRKVVSRWLTLSMRNRHYNLILILLICAVEKYEAQRSSGFFPESHSFLWRMNPSWLWHICASALARGLSSSFWAGPVLFWWTLSGAVSLYRNSSAQPTSTPSPALGQLRCLGNDLSSDVNVTFCVLAWAAVTNSHRRGGLNNKHLSLTVLEAGNPRSWYQLGWVLFFFFFNFGFIYLFIFGCVGSLFLCEGFL